MLTREQIKLLEDYRDKTFIISILAEESCNFYSFIKSIISFPLIISSGIMTVMNSSELEPSVLKPVNIILNALTTLLISFISNYKIAEKCEVFKQMSNKMNKLSHLIDDILTNDFNNCDANDIRQIITDYDSLNESMLFVYPNRIKKKVIKRFKNVRTLPNNLTYDLSPCETPINSKRHSPIHFKQNEQDENECTENECNNEINNENNNENKNEIENSNENKRKINSIKKIYNNNNMSQKMRADFVHV